MYYTDNSQNPYYDIELPSYPQLCIHNIHDHHNLYDTLINDVAGIIINNHDITMEVAAKELWGNDISLCNTLKRYDTGWNDFKELCLSGDDPLISLEFHPHIFTPDLSMHYGDDIYIHTHKKNNGKVVYIIQKNRVYFGTYPTLARKVKKS